MTILFSNPPWWEQTNTGLRQGIRAGSRWPFTRKAVHSPDKFIAGGYLPFPFFLGFAAAYCRQQIPSARVVLRDSIARGESYETFLDYLGLLKPEWLVIETATPSAGHDMNLLQQVGAVSPQTKLIIAGTIVADRSYVRPLGVQAALKGEYEKNVVAAIQSGQPGLYDFNLLTKQEMESLPFPLYDETCHGRYWDACPVMPAALGMQYPHLQIWTSRGCPYKCCFCGWPATMTGNDPDGTHARSVRGHSPDWVHAMLVAAIADGKDHGVTYRSIYLDDDTFNLTDRHAVAISAAMAEIGLPWSAMCRADTLRPDSWKIMRDSGCYGVKVGVESGSQAVIDGIINKRLNLKAVEETHLSLLRDLGFTVHTTWTEGLPGETPAQRAETHAMIERLYMKGLHRTHQLSGTAEITGTPLHTLRVKGDLEKYPAAHADSDYSPSTDGQRKIEGMAS